MVALTSIAAPLCALVLSPLSLGVINRTKAFFGGRRGQPLMQAYYDLAKLLRKSAVYSRSTTWIFPAGPVIGVVSCALALLLLPFGDARAAVAFPGDFLLLAYALGLARFFLVLSALDTGSAFEGMGASREAAYSTLAEVALLVGLGAMAHQSGSWSLSGMLGEGAAPEAGPVLVAVAVYIVLLWENARIPFDDPNTHLELTMVHEVMVLDHSGPDFALVQYGAALKLWIFSAVVGGILLPFSSLPPWAAVAAACGVQLLLAVSIGVVESVMARLRMNRLALLLTGAVGLSSLAVILLLAR